MKPEFSHERDCNTRINPTAPAITTTLPPPPSLQPSTHHHHLSQTQPNMFSKFPPKFETPAIHHPHPQYHHHFHLTKDPQTSEEADSNNTTTTPTPSNPLLKKQKTSTTTTNEDGETVEVVRRPRGRPPGSKNKPKPPVLIPQSEPSPSMSPHILEIPTGLDIIDSLTRLTRRRGIGLCILTASGSVANVSLRQPGGVALTFHGRFEMLSLSALLLPVTNGNLSILNGGNEQHQQQVNGVFTISLAGPQGQIVGGKIVGPLVATGTVYVVAASFNNPSYHRLNGGDGEEDSSGGERQQQQQQQQISESSAGVSGEEVGISGQTPSGIYNSSSCHLNSDVIWAPTARQPPQQHQRGPPPPPPY